MSTYSVTLRGKTFTVALKSRSGTSLTFSVDDRDYTMPVTPLTGVEPGEFSVTLLPKGTSRREASPSKVALLPDIKAPLPGIISDVKVSVGDIVPAGGTLVVIEAMKMENPIKAPADLRVIEVHVTKGQEIPNGALLLSVEPA